MNRENVENKASQYFGSGFHCAESVATAILEQYADQPLQHVPQVAAGFMAGLGGTREELCGALAGGVIAVGYLYGRTAPDEELLPVQKLATAFRERFIEEFGSTKCADILKRLGPQENCATCRELTAAAAGWLAALLED